MILIIGIVILEKTLKFVTRERLVVCSIMIIISYLAVLTYFHVLAFDNAQNDRGVMVTDYNAFYAASLITSQNPAKAYDQEIMRQVELTSIQGLYGGKLTQSQLDKIKVSPWKYPPTYFLFLAPFKHIPYIAAYILTIALTLIPFLIAVLLAAPDRTSILLALAYPGTVVTAIFGQNGFLTAGLLGLGLTQLDRRPWLAGVFFGLLSFKPHFGLLIPIALIAGGYWKVILSATLTICLFVLVSILAYGLDPWVAFIGSLKTSGAMQEITFSKMPTIFAAVRLLGGSIDFAQACQAIMALAAVIVRKSVV